MTKPSRQAPASIMMRARGPRGFSGPLEKATDAKGTLKRIWSYMKKQRAPILLAILFVIVTTGLGILIPYLIGVTVDDYIIPMDLSGTGKLLVTIGGAYILSSLFTWIQNLLMVNVSLETIRNIREEIFNKFHSLPLRFFDKHSHGDLMSRVTNDMDTLKNALSQSVIQIISTILMVSGVAIAMALLNWMLAIAALLIIPLMMYTTKKIIAYSSSNFIKRQRDLGQLNGFIEESISGNDVIALFGHEENANKSFAEINERLRRSATAADTVSGFLGPVNNFINNLGLGLIIAVGSLLTLNDLASVGIIAAFVTYSRQLYRPINMLSNLLNTFQSAIAGAERVFEVMDEKEELLEHDSALAIDTIKGDVSFSNVSFSYDEDKPTLKNINFQVKAGEKVALVGPTGSGKTTIANLLMRFYDINEGDILIDGCSIKDYQMDQLRKKIGVVLQDTFLFSGTIMENIRYGRLDASDDEVISAAKRASAHGFIKYLPDQYDTPIQSGGTSLSQGQRQLIAIAQAMLADSDLLILDEATSSIDTRTEKEIQRGLDELMLGKTSFVIAHRLKTIESADRILVIRHGQLIESGTHEDLLAQKGFYYQLYDSQLRVKA